jgi:hypothetical protein
MISVLMWPDVYIALGASEILSHKLVCRLRVVGRKGPERWRPNSWFSLSRQCSSTPVGFGQGFLSKEQRDNTGTSSPILSIPVSN